MTLNHEWRKGIWRENPTLVLLLGLCPTLAVTTGVKNALGMGLAVTFVLICANALISCTKKLVPSEIRIPVYIVVIATFVTVVKLLMAAYLPALKEALGIFLALIAVNCIVLGRAEAFAAKNPPLASALDGAGMGLGFTLALSLIALVREILGSGTLFDVPLATGLEPYTMKIFILAPGGFLTLGLLLAFFAWREKRHNNLWVIKNNLQRERRRRSEEISAPEKDRAPTAPEENKNT
jgi:electron transport complex protein RnfE